MYEKHDPFCRKHPFRKHLTGHVPTLHILFTYIYSTSVMWYVFM